MWDDELELAGLGIVGDVVYALDVEVHLILQAFVRKNLNHTIVYGRKDGVFIAGYSGLHVKGVGAGLYELEGLKSGHVELNKHYRMNEFVCSAGFFEP